MINNNIDQDRNSSTCNCRNKQVCPLDQKCMLKNIVYKATITTEPEEEQKPKETKYYIGIAQTTFKDRLGNHTSSCTNEEYKNNTSLSAYIWKLKKEKMKYKINWEIITRAPSCKNLNSTCYLCIQEKIAIQNFSPKEHLLNRRSEIAVKCRHKSKFLLKTWKDKSKKT